MFRVVLSPIIRSAYNCIYSIWYLSYRYCYLPLSWKSWNRFECAVGGVRSLFLISKYIQKEVKAITNTNVSYHSQGKILNISVQINQPTRCRSARPQLTALLPPRSSSKTRGCYCSWASEDGRVGARNMLRCT
jgi:hypothetical protein